MIITMEKDEMIIKPEIKLGRLIFANYLENLLLDLKNNIQANKNLNILNNIIQAAQKYSHGETLTTEYLSPKDAFNFVTKSLDSTELLKYGFDHTINNILITIEHYKTDTLTEDTKFRLIKFLEVLIENSSYTVSPIEERNRFEW